MGKPTGFLDYNRETAKVLPPKVRIANFNEFRTPLSKEKQRLQGARCMACGVPFCQSGMMLGGMASGCPLHNLVPETNDLVYTGNWKQAYLRLSKTHSFPEFTSRVCPALCEAACTCNLNGEPVATKENERAIIETAYKEGWVQPQKPNVRTGKTIAVIGSGPSGLAAAQQLNRRGHSVTGYERRDRPGGLLRYGIPNMKLEKSVIDRRIRLMEEEGVKFVLNTNVGKDISMTESCLPAVHQTRETSKCREEKQKESTLRWISWEWSQRHFWTAILTKFLMNWQKEKMFLSSAAVTQEMTVWEPQSVWVQNL